MAERVTDFGGCGCAGSSLGRILIGELLGLTGLYGESFFNDRD